MYYKPGLRSILKCMLVSQDVMLFQYEATIHTYTHLLTTSFENNCAIHINCGIAISTFVLDCAVYQCDETYVVYNIIQIGQTQ